MLLSKWTLPILGLPRIIKRLIVMLVDSSICIISVYLAFYFRLGHWVPLFSKSNWDPLIVLGVSLLLALPVFLLLGLYREIFRHSGWFALLIIIRAIAIYSAIFIFIFAVVGIEGVPRTIGFIQPILLLFLAGSVRAGASYWLSNSYRRQLKLSAVPRVLIYGAGDAGRQLHAALARSFEMQVVGFLDDDRRLHGSNLGGKRIYSPDHLNELIVNLNVAEILLAIPSAARSRRNHVIRTMREAKVKVKTLPSMGDLVSGKVSTQDLRSLDIDDLLGRDLVLPSSDLLTKNISLKKVLVTGAGGSIGSELCRQIIAQRPALLILVEQSEYALYQIHHELNSANERSDALKIQIVPIIASVVNADRIRSILDKWRPDVIYHAAAYKHVPLVEANIVEGIRNNAIGTQVIAQIAIELEVPYFILISTDKAVRPTNVMGASKRLAEMILQALSQNSAKTKFSMVRFGNVLNSSGSVVPKFSQQIRDGGPVTVTDFRMTRYFMTIPEAAQLVIQAGALSTGGDVFLLDMGEPVKIIDLARRMIELSGLEVRDENNPYGDIELQEVGLRPGEKLYEELLIDGHPEVTLHPRIFKSKEQFLPWDDLKVVLDRLIFALKNGDEHKLISLLKEAVIQYSPSNR